MASYQPRTAPDQQDTGWPKGIPYIIGNEGCERFSYYGMRAILTVYLTYLFKESGMAADLAEKEAQILYHTFAAGVYALPMIGAMIADRLFGKYQTILWLSIVYVLGHACLALFESNLTGFKVGLLLIAVGSGGIKPCVSAHVGDQFGPANWFRLERVYQLFYFIINFGSFFSTIICPWVLNAEWGGPTLAFGLPGILMAIATVFFWMGRKVFIHVPPDPGGKLGWLDAIAGSLLFLSVGSLMFFDGLDIGYETLGWGEKIGVSLIFIVAGYLVVAIRQRMEEDDGFVAVLLYNVRAWVLHKESTVVQTSAGASAEVAGPRFADAQTRGFWAPAARHYGDEVVEGPRAVVRISSVFFLVSVFWALFDQHGSSWVIQGTKMDQEFMGMTILPSQMAAWNPLMVMGLIPLFTFGVYPFFEKVFKIKMTPLRRMAAGMMLAGFSFIPIAHLQRGIDAGETPNIMWQFFPYLIITSAEVMVSITGLEFAYSQAPKRMKSVIMGLWLFCVSLGNVLVVFLTGLKNLSTENFFWACAGLMFAASIIFSIRAAFYQYRDYTQ